MTLKSSNTGKTSEDTLRAAKFVYKRLARGLQKLVERLEGGLGSEDPTATKAQLQGHFKLLQQIVDMEIALGKREKLDLSRFSAAPSSHLSGSSFESQALPDSGLWNKP